MDTKALVAAGLGAALVWLRGRSGYSFRGRSVLITGGSRGLGLLLARAFAEQGAKLTLMARDRSELERARRELAKNGAAPEIVVGDVADEGAAQRAVAAAVKAYGGLDVLINNAGIIQAGPLASMTRRDFEQTMDVHFWGAYTMTMAALPHLRRGGEGRIVNIASIGGKVAVPHLAPYSASKFALVGLSDGLRAELAPEGVRVTTVIPGLMRTGSHMNALFKGQHRTEFALFAPISALPITSINAERAARQIVQACREGAPQLVISWQANAAILAQTAAPGLLARLMALVAQLLPGPPAHGGKQAHTGWESQSEFAPSPLTILADRATERNNERPPRARWRRRD